jgi:hypothetical protein
MLAARRTPGPPFKATVLQPLRGSRHLVETEQKTTFLLDLLPDRGALPRGTPVTCHVEYAGVYEYNTVEGLKRRVKHLRELTEAERTGKRWKSYPEFSRWLKEGNVCELRQSEPAPCQACAATGVIPGPAGGPRTKCTRCNGTGRESRVTLHHLVWTSPAARTPAP